MIATRLFKGSHLPGSNPGYETAIGQGGMFAAQVRTKLMQTNFGLTQAVADQIISECHAKPALHAVMWVDGIVRKAEKSQRNIALMATLATCSGIRHEVAKKRRSSDPKDFEAIISYHIGSVPWDVTPYTIGVVIAMLRATEMICEAWEVS